MITTLLVGTPIEAVCCVAGRAAHAGGQLSPTCRSEAAQHLYTRETLASTLCLMGAKPRHSVKVAARVFEVLSALSRRNTAGPGSSRAPPHRLPRLVAREVVFEGSSALLPRPHFEALVAWALAEYSYSKADQADDLRLACRRAVTRGAATAVLTRLSG
jgi:hypothetical protein